MDGVSIFARYVHVKRHEFDVRNTILISHTHSYNGKIKKWDDFYVLEKFLKYGLYSGPILDYTVVSTSWRRFPNLSPSFQDRKSKIFRSGHSIRSDLFKAQRLNGALPIHVKCVFSRIGHREYFRL